MPAALWLVLVLSCAPAQPAPSASPRGTTDYDHPSWRQLIVAARAEGKLTMRGAPNPVAREQIPRQFKERFGVEIEWDSARASDVYARLESERAAGLYTMDVIISGNDTADMVGKGWLQPIPPLLVVPEATDSSAWRNDRLPFLDPEGKYMFQIERAVYGSFVVNPEFVRDGEITRLDDLLNPKWKAKFSVDDPTVSGFGQLNAVYLLLEKGEDFVRKFFVDQAPVVSRDDRQIEDWLARGAHPISFGLAPKNVAQMQEQGLAVKDLGPLDGRGWVRGPILVVMDNPPHPNATKLFVNWIASPEGMHAHAFSEQLPPTRKDLDHPWAQGHVVPREGADYFDADDYTFTVERRPALIRRLRELLAL